VDLPVEGAASLKAALIPVVQHDTTADPLGRDGPAGLEAQLTACGDSILALACLKCVAWGDDVRQKDKTDGSRKDRAAYLATRYEEDYFSYQYCFVEFFLDHLGDVSKAFNGDLQQVLILGLVGQVRLNAVKRAVVSGRDPAHLELAETVISASRIADVSGIPRQTVRRKLALLEAQGWIAQAQDGGWHLIVDPQSGESPAKRDLDELDRRARVRIARLVANLEDVADREAQ
jgi:hypothetical protein